MLGRFMARMFIMRHDFPMMDTVAVEHGVGGHGQLVSGVGQD